MITSQAFPDGKDRKCGNGFRILWGGSSVTSCDRALMASPPFAHLCAIGVQTRQDGQGAASALKRGLVRPYRTSAVRSVALPSVVFGKYNDSYP